MLLVQKRGFSNLFLLQTFFSGDPLLGIVALKESVTTELTLTDTIPKTECCKGNSLVSVQGFI